MRVYLELYASLMKYLPGEANGHRISVDVPSDTNAHALLERYQVPLEEAHLLVRNGVFLHRDEREQLPLQEGDVISAWPPVAGG
jgi:sulfur carrier protein ThiS